MTLAAEDEKHIRGLRKASGSALRVHRLLQSQPIVSIGKAGQDLGLSVPNVTAALGHLAQFEIVREITGRRYGRSFAYGTYLQILDEGIETP